MGLKADWRKEARPEPPVELRPEVEEVIRRAARLTRSQLVRLDLAERRRADARIIAWQLLRDRIDGAGFRAHRLAARTRSWDAVNQTVERLGLEPTTDDGYWYVAGRVGTGAARAARFAACALIAPELVEPEILDILLEPWQEIDWHAAPEG